MARKTKDQPPPRRVHTFRSWHTFSVGPASGPGRTVRFREPNRRGIPIQDFPAYADQFREDSRRSENLTSDDLNVRLNCIPD